jgi:hypothetical protein
MVQQISKGRFDKILEHDIKSMTPPLFQLRCHKSNSEKMPGNTGFCPGPAAQVFELVQNRTSNYFAFLDVLQ